jgi:hypothetical protein
MGLRPTEGDEEAVGQAFSPTGRYLQGVFNGADEAEGFS